MADDDTNALPPLPPGATFVPNQPAELPPLPEGAIFVPATPKEQVTSKITYGEPVLNPQGLPYAAGTTPPGSITRLPGELGQPAYDPDLSFYQNWKRGAYIPDFDITDPSTWDRAIMKKQVEGWQTAEQGFTQMTNPLAKGTTPGRQLVGGTTKIVSGLGEAAAPFVLPPLMVGAPIPTLVGMGVGALAGWGAGETGKALGLAPEYQEGLSALGNLVGGAAAAGFADAMMPYLRIGPGALTNAQAAAIQYAKQYKIPVSAALQTAREWVTKLQEKTASTGVAARSQAATEAALGRQAQALGGAPVTPEAAGAGINRALEQVVPARPTMPGATPEAAGAGLRTAVESRMPAVPTMPGATVTPEEAGAGVIAGLTGAKPAAPAAGVPTIPEVAGAGVEAGLGQAESAYAAGARKRYQEFGSIEADNAKPVIVGYQDVNVGTMNGTPVIQREPIYEQIGFPTDMRNAKATLAPFRDELMKELPIGLRETSTGLQALNNLLDGPDVMSATIADKYLGTIKGIRRERGVNDRTKYLLGQAVDAVSPAVDQAAALGGPDAVEALAEGRRLTTAKYATRQTAESLPDEPVGIFKMMTSPADIKVNLLRDIQTHAPESLPAIGRAYDQGMLETAQTDPDAAIRSWDRLGDATKGMLFSPDQIMDRNRYFAALKPIQATLDSLGKEPVKVFNKITTGGDASLNLLRTVQSQAPNSVPLVGQAYHQGLMETAGQNLPAAIRAWRSLGDATKQILLPADQIAKTDQFFRVAEPIQGLLGQLPEEPIKLFNKLTAGGDANINLLRDVQTHVPQSIPDIAGAYHQGLMETADQDINAAIRSWRKLGDATKQILFKPDYIANTDSFLNIAGQIQSLKLPGEPVGLFEKLTRPRDLNIDLLRAVQTHAPGSMPVVGDAYIQNLFKQDPARALSDWRDLGDNTKQILYSPQRIDDIGNQLQLRQMQAEVPQAAKPTGGTQVWSLIKRAWPEIAAGAGAYSMSGLSWVTLAKAAAFDLGLRGVVGLSKRVIARMLWNPRTAQNLIEGYRPSRTPLGAAAVGAAAAGMTRQPQQGYAKGGYLRDLERRAFSRQAALSHLMR
jgi:hypothetical protein